MSEPQYLLPDGRVPVVVSADDADLLANAAARLARYLRARPDVDIHRAAGYLLDARPVRRHRAIIAATDRDGLLAALDALAAGAPHPDAVCGTASAHRIGYVYPGQGSQRHGMGAVDYAQSPAYRAAVDECHRESMAMFTTSPLDYVLGRDGAAETDDVTVVQPALFMHMLGLTAMWDAAGVAPALTVGHSQGEIAAAVRSGLMTLADGLIVVTERARAVDEIAPRGYTMAVVGVSVDEAERLLARDSGWMELSVVNSAHLLCVSGERSAVLGLIERVEADGKFAKEIRVAYPAHTSIVSALPDMLTAPFDAHEMGEGFADPQIPCIGATLGEAVGSSTPFRDYWFWNLRNRVRFDRAVTVAADTADVFIEIAEHPTLVLALSETLASRPEARVFGTRRRDCADHTLFTRNVLSVAAIHADFDWQAWAVPGRATNPPLEGFPNSVMRRTRLWARHDAGAADLVNRVGSAPVRPDHDVRVLQAVWQRLTRRQTVAPQQIAILTPEGADTALAAAICAAAPEHGVRAWQVPVESGSGRTDIGHPDAALLLLPTGSDDGDGGVEGGVESEIAAVLADARWRGGLTDLPATFWVVSTGAEPVVDGECSAPAHAGIVAGLRCLAVESGVRVAQLDLPGGGGTGASASADDILGAVHVADEAAVALRDGGLYVKRLLPVESGAPAGGCGEPREDVGHVVITGGTGRIGLAMAQRCARDGARRITLLSRSGGDDRAQRTVARIGNRFGVPIDVRRCDLTDPESVAATAVDLAPVSVLVHAALDYVDRSLDDIGDDDVRRAFGAKVNGAQSLLDALGPVGRVILCSSMAATLGGRDQALYAASNRVLEAAAERWRAAGVDTVAIGWGLWAIQGPLDAIGLARVTATGVVPMDPSAALDVGLAVRGTDARVLAASWPDLRGLLTLTGTASLISEVPDALVVPPDDAVETASVVTEPAPSPDAESIAEPITVPEPTGQDDLADEVIAELASTMGLSAADIDPGAPLVALGMDSLQALDFRKRVQSSLDCELPVEAILGGASLTEVLDLMGAEPAAS